MDLDAVDIDGVLVEGSAAYVVLAAQFVGLTDAGKRDEQTLNTSSCGVRHDACRRSINAVHRALRTFDAAHLYLRQHLLVRQELYIDIQYILQVNDALLHRSIANHREIQYHGVGFV